MALEYTYQNFYEDNAKVSPKKPVIFIEDRKVDNLRFKQKIDTFARFLEFSGVKAKDRVAMIVGNSEEFMISLFAITKVGAIVVPINTFLKREEFEYIVNDCGAKMLISSSNFAKETKNLLYSTKVELSYRNIFSNVISGASAFKIDEKDRFLVFLPMFHSFTLSIMVILPVMVNSSVIIVKSVFPFANVLKQALLKRATIFLGVPSLYNSLIKAKIPWYFMWFNKIRIFISGSAPLSEAVLNDFSKKFKNAVLTEGYGLSECSPAVAVNRLEKQKPLSVGLPLDSYEVKIVDDEMVELPTGEVGEIIVKGDCVMQGYLNRPDATEEVKVNGWLLTGDLGKLDEDGFLYIVDRKKDLIISKGINIYPREIEEIISKYEGVDSVAVIGVSNETKDEEVMAFVQSKEDVNLDELKMKKYLKSHLANFKLPKHIYFVEELPKNATGKVLKRVLKEQVLKGHFSK